MILAPRRQGRGTAEVWGTPPTAPSPGGRALQEELGAGAAPGEQGSAAALCFKS